MKRCGSAGRWGWQWCLVIQFQMDSTAVKKRAWSSTSCRYKLPCALHACLCAQVFEVGSLKSGAYGGSSGEFILDDLPQAAKDAGWSIDPSRVALAAGDKKPVTVTWEAVGLFDAACAAFLARGLFRCFGSAVVLLLGWVGCASATLHQCVTVLWGGICAAAMPYRCMPSMPCRTVPRTCTAACVLPHMYC